MTERKGLNYRQLESETKTLPFGAPVMPDLPQAPATTGEGIASQVQAVSQIPERHQEVISFAKSFFPQKSPEEVEEWVEQHIKIDPDGTVRLEGSEVLNIEGLQAPIQFPNKIVIEADLTIWPSSHKILMGEKTFIGGKLTIVGDPNIAFPEFAEFYVEGNVIFLTKTPEVVVRMFKNLKRQSKIHGKIVQKQPISS